MTPRRATLLHPLAALLLTATLAPAYPAEAAEETAVDSLWTEAETAAQDGVSAEELASLGERALALAQEAEEPGETIRAVGLVLSLSQHRLGAEPAALRSRAVELLLERRIDTQPLSDEDWNALFRALDVLRRPEAGDVRADREAVDEYFRLLDRIERRAATDRLRAITTFLRLENRLLVDRLLGGLSPGERAMAAAEVRERWERWAEVRLNDRATFAEAARWPLNELELLHLGATAPEIAGVDLQGKPMKLSDYRGRVVLLDFWASWCPPCVAAIPRQRELLDRIGREGFAIVGVSGDQEREDGLEAEERHGATWRSFWAYWPGEDEEALPPLKDTWYVRFWPTYYVLDQEGVIRYKASWDDDDLSKVEEVVVALLAAAP